MGLDLEISGGDVARVLGRAALPFSHAQGRELEEADLARLAVEQGIKAPPIARLSDRHHALAKALAEGISPGQASITTGYSLSRISILKADPSFQELVSFYRSEKDLRDADVMARLSNLTLSAVSLLEDRLENDPDEIRTRELLDIATAGLDRSGHGPSSKLQVTNLTLSKEDMEKLALSAQEKNVTIIEARPQGSGAADRGTPITISLASAEAEGEQSQGYGAREGSGESPGDLGEAIGRGSSIRAVD